MRLYLINEIETNIFKPKQVKELDDLQDKIDLCKNLINLIKNKLNDIMCDKIKANDTIKVESNDRDGYYLILTKKRSEILRKELESLKFITIGTEKIKTDTFEYRDNPKASNTKIFIPDVNKKSDELINHILLMKKKSKLYYQDFLEEFYNKFKYIMNDVNYYVSMIDFIKTYANP